MEQIKPINLYSLAFSDKQGNMIVKEEFDITFGLDSDCEKFIQDRYKYWKELLGRELLILPNKQETLTEIEVRNILRLVAKWRGVTLQAVMSGSHKRQVVEVRRQTMAIARRRKLGPSSIGRALKTSHDLVIYHYQKFVDYYETDQAYRDGFDEMENFIYSTLFGLPEK
jgi:hypothetical protein